MNLQHRPYAILAPRPPARLTIAQAASRLGVSRSKIYRDIRRGTVKTIEGDGRSKLIEESEFHRAYDNAILSANETSAFKITDTAQQTPSADTSELLAEIESLRERVTDLEAKIVSSKKLESEKQPIETFEEDECAAQPREPLSGEDQTAHINEVAGEQVPRETRYARSRSYYVHKKSRPMRRAVDGVLKYVAIVTISAGIIGTVFAVIHVFSSSSSTTASSSIG